MNINYLKTNNYLVLIGFFFLISCESEVAKTTLDQKTPSQENSKLKSKVPLDTINHIYLTFDDGPNTGTGNLIQVIEDQKVKMSTFVVGKHVYDSKKQEENMQKLITSSLIEVCNHSYSHAYNRYSAFYKNKEQVLQDFNQCKDSLKFLNTFARTPGRNIWRLVSINSTDIISSTVTADYLTQNGYQLVGWDLECHYDRQNQLTETPEKIQEQISNLLETKSTKKEKHLVLLMHDQCFSDSLDCAQLTNLIQGLKKSKKYAFHHISEYPTIQNNL